MSHKWEYEDEYLRLDSEIRRARKEADNATIQRIKPRLDQLNWMIWQSMVRSFPELAPYSNLVEALEQLCLKKGLPFPDLSDRQHNFTGKGDWKESQQFIFGVGNGKRSIQIWPMEERGYISIELYDDTIYYKGKTISIGEAAIVLSQWYMQESSIDELHQQFSWMSTERFKSSGPRVTYE